MQKEKLVLSFLEDEESRYILEKRLLYNKTGIYKYIYEIVERCLADEYKGKYYYHGKEKEIIDYVRDKKKIVVFGYGIRGKKLVNMLLDENIKIYKIIDNNSDIAGGSFRSIEISTPNDILYNEVDCIIISPSNFEIVSSMKKQLMDLGANVETIMLFRDFSLLPDITNIYFDENIIKFNEKEVFIDAGVYNLGTSKEFAKRCKENGISEYKIYAFEPDRVSFQRCEEIQRSSGLEVSLYERGLYSESTTLYFKEKDGGSSCIIGSETETSINVISLDDFWIKEGIEDVVTFIKMDIEGAEFEALKGCKEIIKRYKPKLAISVYHKKEDILEIPLYIKELVPEYKIYFRHYSNCMTETVLYAVLD